MQKASKLLNPNKLGAGAKLFEALSQTVVSQIPAIDSICSVYEKWAAGLADPSRPVGNFLFLGPTGTGKTYVVESLARELVGTEKAVLKVDCGELQHSHDISKLQGSPPGYLGHRETEPMFTQSRLDGYHTETCKLSIVMFDEIEKASDAVWKLLLGILDKGSFTTGDNKKVDFTKSLIFMTSNVGSRQIEELIQPRFGFGNPNAGEQSFHHRLSKAGLAMARKKFQPEFFNRLDHVATFAPLSLEEMEHVLDLELEKLQNRLFLQLGAQSLIFSLTPAAKEYLLRTGFDRRYGARPLKRTIEKILVVPISNFVSTEQVAFGDMILVDRDGTELVYTTMLRKLNRYELKQGAKLVKEAGFALIPEQIQSRKIKRKGAAG